MTLGSRKELDCLVQFINDQFDEPAFEVKGDQKYLDKKMIRTNIRGRKYSNIFEYLNIRHTMRESDPEEISVAL